MARRREETDRDAWSEGYNQALDDVARALEAELVGPQDVVLLQFVRTLLRRLEGLRR